MANTNAPFGLRPVRLFNGGDIRSTEYSIASAYGTKIYLGDVVEMTGTGTNIQLAAGGNADNLGVFAGCSYINEQGRPTWSHYWPASSSFTQVKAYVWDDPNIIFEVQVTTLAAADIGQLADMDDETGSTLTGLSGRSLSATSLASTDKSFRVLRLSPSPDNAYGAYAKAEVMFQEHVLKGVVAGVGGV